MAGEESKIFKLLTYALNEGNVFLPEEQFASELVEDCLKLFNCDYVCSTIDNKNGSLCSTYPIQIIIPIHQKVNGNFKNGITNFKESDMTDLIQRGRFARTRGRFPAPVILVAGKYVCRSSTLARSPEIYGRTSYQYLTSSGQNENDTLVNSSSQNHIKNGFVKQSPKANSNLWKYKVNEESIQEECKENNNLVNGNSREKNLNGNGQNKEWLLDKMRNTDIDLLHHLKVNVICDFMVEKKKVKFGMNVTSSEKVDRQQRYSDFGLICIPYPGCEFFADYKHNNYTGIGLKFDWSQQFVDAKLQVPEKVHNVPGVQWNNYVDWDLVKLTQNYLKLLLNCITKPCSSGMLLHCISGWDRTPLFVSLLRLSLWADGIIHQSLNADDIVYLTLAYDWLLFSHQFADRIEKSEEIMHFCFYFLKYISSVDFSLLPHLNNTDLFTSENGNSVEDMFDFEQSDAENQNILNGISLNNSYLNDHLSQNTDMQEIQECLHNLVDQASKSDCLHCDNVLNNDNLSLENESTTITCNENSHLTPATLPLIYTSTHQLNGLTHTNEPDNVFDKNYILATTPNSALSTSFNKAKNNLNAFESDHDLISNSFPTANKRVSEPIFVPNGKVSSQSLDCLLDKVSNVGSSSNTGNAEPGSSWQLISPLAAPQEQTRMNTSPESSRKSSTVSSITSETSVFKSKLLRRKERLESATNVMIPAYCAAVQKRRQEQEQASTLSTMFGNIAHFIKRA